MSEQPLDEQLYITSYRAVRVPRCMKPIYPSTQLRFWRVQQCGHVGVEVLSQSTYLATYHQHELCTTCRVSS